MSWRMDSSVNRYLIICQPTLYFLWICWPILLHLSTSIMLILSSSMVGKPSIDRFLCICRPAEYLHKELSTVIFIYWPYFEFLHICRLMPCICRPFVSQKHPMTSLSTALNCSLHLQWQDSWMSFQGIANSS